MSPNYQSSCLHCLSTYYFFFFNDTATTEIYTLSLHDALPICARRRRARGERAAAPSSSGPSTRPRSRDRAREARAATPDRKSTRLNSSHGYISYAVFCLKKKKTKPQPVDSVDDTPTEAMPTQH